MAKELPHPIADFLADLERRDASPRTRESYARDLAQFGRWFEGSTGEAFAPERLTRSDVRDYRAHLLTVEHRAPATVNRRLAALRAFFRFCRARGLLREDPTTDVKGIATAPRAPRWLEKREVDRLIRAVERHGSKRDLAVVLTLRHTGVRVSELCGLTLADLTLSERKGEVVVRGKRRKVRVLPLNVDARRALREYLAVRPQAESTALFIGQRGEGLKPRAIEKVVEKYARAAQLEQVTPHTLRHSFAKHLLDGGEPLTTLPLLLGHERLETVAIYTTPSLRDLARAVDRLSAEAAEAARREPRSTFRRSRSPGAAPAPGPI
jgi:site-specific recombinase XerD